MKRIFRFVVSFLLICVILVNCSPIRARAVEPVTMVMVSAATVIASVMIGIGVMMGQNREAFDQVVQMVQGSNALKDFIQQDATKGDVIPLYRSPGTGGVGSGALTLLVAGALIEAIRQVLFDESVVSETPIPDGYASYNGCILPVIPVSYDCQLIFHKPSDNTYFVFFSNKPISTSDGWYGISGSGCYYNKYKLLPDTDVWSRVGGGGPYNGATFKFQGEEYNYIWCNSDISTSSGEVVHFGCDPVTNLLDVSGELTAGEIAPQEQELSEGYSDWVAGSQWDVNNSQWWPVAVAPTYDETVNFSQEQVQKGEGTLKEEDLGDNTDPEPDFDQVTASGLKGWIDGLKDRITLLLQPLSLTVSNILDAVSVIPEAIVSPIKDFFTPSGNVDSYAIDLTSFFPFCIPFDLYDFLSLLLAEPEAPHFEFDIDFPYMNEPWHLVIDLSPWDGVAQLLRRLELLLFIVGLGMVTREKFLRG